MNTLLRRAVFALALMATCAALANWMKPRTLLAEQRSTPLKLEAAVPTQFAGWQMATDGFQGVVNPQTQEALNRIYTQILTRTYVNAAGQRIMLSIAYGAEQSRRGGLQLHQPEICYPAQGFEVRTNVAGSVAVANGVIPVRRLNTAFANQRYEPVTYWTMTGDHATVAGYGKRLVELNYSLRGLIPDGLLFRVSSIGQDTGAEFELQREFIGALVPALTPDARKQLTGLP